MTQFCVYSDNHVEFAGGNGLEIELGIFTWALGIPRCWRYWSLSKPVFILAASNVTGSFLSHIRSISYRLVRRSQY